MVGGTKRGHLLEPVEVTGRSLELSDQGWSWGLVTAGERVDRRDGYCGNIVGIPAFAIRRCESELSLQCKCAGSGNNTTSSVIIEVVITLITLPVPQISVSAVHTCHFIL